MGRALDRADARVGGKGLVSTLSVKVLRMPGSAATVSAGRPVTVSAARAHHSCLTWSDSVLPLSVSSTMLARLSEGAGLRWMWPERGQQRRGPGPVSQAQQADGLVDRISLLEVHRASLTRLVMYITLCA